MQDHIGDWYFLFLKYALKQKKRVVLWTSVSTCGQWSWSLHMNMSECQTHDDVIKWKHFPRYWPFVRRIHRSPVNSPHKGQWRGALMFSLIWIWINGWVSNREAGDLRRHRVHYDVTVMLKFVACQFRKQYLNSVIYFVIAIKLMIWCEYV